MGVVIWREGSSGREGDGRVGRRGERWRRKGGKEGGEREGDNTQHATSKVDVLHSRIHTYIHFAYTASKWKVYQVSH